MKRGDGTSRSITFPEVPAAIARVLAKGRRLSPLMGAPAFRALRRVAWLKLLLCLGFVVQACLVLLVWQLVDLCIGLMEVWLDLARKHLEITLS
jgi:hypothetical protein